MMVPRSYTYASPPPSPKMAYNEKDLTSVDTAERGGKKARSKKESVRTRQGPWPPGIGTPSPSTPSKPVVIPTRTRHDGRRKSTAQAPTERKLSSEPREEHNQSLNTPSMSALLAMTSIPTPKRLSHSSSGQRKAFDVRREDNGHRTQPQIPRRALSSSSPQTWDFLLSPPNDDSVDSGSFSSDTTIAPPSSIRSLSTESMPSLEEDRESIFSASDPATPALNAGSRGDRKKSLSTSKGKDCILDHPLLLPPPAANISEDAENAEIRIGSRESRPVPPRRPTSFKSNLTASFRAVRSAARSISDWTAPSTNMNRDDHLSQSLLSLTLPYTVERRPQTSDHPPDPALRRYLNPITLSPAELHFHDPSTELQAKACIQMETYQRGSRPSQHASSPPIFPSKKQMVRKGALDTEDSLPSSSLSPRQREPRENSDFLRVIVLEMNMRKAGKLPGTNPGRAKLWLPPRQGLNKGAVIDGEGQAEALAFRGITVHAGTGKLHARSIPDRWTGITP